MTVNVFTRIRAWLDGEAAKVQPEVNALEQALLDGAHAVYEDFLQVDGPAILEAIETAIPIVIQGLVGGTFSAGAVVAGVAAKVITQFEVTKPELVNAVYTSIGAVVAKDYGGSITAALPAAKV